MQDDKEERRHKMGHWLLKNMGDQRHPVVGKTLITEDDHVATITSIISDREDRVIYRIQIRDTGEARVVVRNRGEEEKVMLIYRINRKTE